MLSVESLTVHRGASLVLKDVTLCVDAGEIVTLLGANGAGKSTLLMSLCGVLPATSGRVVLGSPQGVDITRCSTERIVRLGLTQVPEGRLVFPRLSVRDNLLTGAYPRKDRENLASDEQRVYDLFPVLGTRRHQLGGTLSGGEQQMLAIGRALMARPAVLLLDEPSLGLAPMFVEHIFTIIKRLNAEGATILLVEQNATMALGIAHRGYVLEHGRITLTGAGEALMADPRVRQAYLGFDDEQCGDQPRASIF